MTGLGNRTALIARLREKLADADTVEAGHFAVVHIDIDRFRMINESLGVIKGDDVIAAVGTRLAEGLTEGDLSRFGGDEFVAIIDNVPTPTLPPRAAALWPAWTRHFGSINKKSLSPPRRASLTPL